VITPCNSTAATPTAAKGYLAIFTGVQFSGATSFDSGPYEAELILLNSCN